MIAIYYDAKDYQSKIALVEFGLGKTKYDVQLKRYSVHEAMERSDPFVSLKELGLQEGIPAWIRIRVTNNGEEKLPLSINICPPNVNGQYAVFYFKQVTSQNVMIFNENVSE